MLRGALANAAVLSLLLLSVPSLAQEGNLNGEWEQVLPNDL